MRLFDSAAPGLRRYVRSCGVTQEAAEDIVQDAFVALFRHLQDGGARDNLRGWLARVSYRLALKHRQQLARRQRHEHAWDDWRRYTHRSDNPEAQLTASQHDARVQAAFRALPERERQCLLLRAEGIRYRDIGKTLGISLGSVAKAIAYAIRRLSNAVEA